MRRHTDGTAASQMDLLEHCNRLTQAVEISPSNRRFPPRRTQKQLSTSIRHVLSCLSLRGSLPIAGEDNHQLACEALNLSYNTQKTPICRFIIRVEWDTSRTEQTNHALTKTQVCLSVRSPDQSVCANCQRSANCAISLRGMPICVARVGIYQQFAHSLFFF